MSARVDPAIHRSRPWRVHELAADFTVLDTWLIPVRADPACGVGLADFLRFVISSHPAGTVPAAFLFWVRGWLGRLFGWDRDDVPLPIPGCRETTVADRLTAADRACNRAADLPPPAIEIAEPRVIYLFDDEALMEVSNQTIHALLHFGWVDGPGGTKQPELAIYIKTRGAMSRLYMRLIGPFRHVVVYPAWFGKMAREWPAYVRAPVHPAEAGQPSGG